ncbi:TetR/AcrR family transcriptional regulator [Actinocorallia sp. B10E7]|uniref:TetR/AcrR family transcriptional regulator n=1 Tax=Actinocorallia sp. B10E7 TaxID=3153558 RepID=UPI00325E2752
MTPNTKAPVRRKRMSRAERESQMLEVAEEVFAEQGYRATSMEEIAERCGVSKPMLYEHFGSKDGLLLAILAILARARAELHHVTSEAMALGRDPLDVLYRGLVAYYSFTRDHSRSFALLMHEPMALPDATIEAIEDVRRQQHGLIAPVLASQAPHLDPVQVEAYTEIIIGACERISLWCTRRPEITPEEATRYTLDLCWSGLSGTINPENDISGS